ncbi:MAG: PhzF family phenazine biosynthesis protein [Bradyrhizobium sp.]|nr:PhzF family phenazine biosynthesis protein [Bradyrhizobium sp.]
MMQIDLVDVFTFGGTGGNPCPIVVDASGLDARAMQEVAARCGHESAFVLPPPSGDYDHAFRFFVPRHEMEMCGHATIGALWVLHRRGLIAPGEFRIATRSGPVTGFVSLEPEGATVEITQPAGKVVDLTAEQERRVLSTLNITRADLLDAPLQNAVTSRVKTLVPIRDVECLNQLRTDMALTEACCVSIGSTGLYPYAVVDAATRVFEARQFPRSSGYPEDAATGIAASALAFGLVRAGLAEADDRAMRVRQGRAIGQLSEIRVRLGYAGGQAIGCLLGGSISPAAGAA